MAMQPGGMHEGGRVVNNEESLEAQMMRGSWRIHGQSGAPVCTSALKTLLEMEGETVDTKLECLMFYCKHVARELLQVWEPHWGYATLGRRLGELLGAQRENDKLNARLNTINRELIEVSAKNAVLEKDKERITRDRDKADDDYVKIRKYADDCRCKADEFERQLSHLDSNRHCKKITPQNSGSGAQYRQPATQGTDKDVTMHDASGTGNQLTMTWGNLTSIPKLEVRGHSILDHPFFYSAQKRCWPVAILVFRTYYEARMVLKNGKTLSLLQRHVLDNYAIPDWMLGTWKEWVLDTDAQNKNQSFWAMAHRPRGGTVRELVAYIQKQGREVEGCPFSDNYHTIRSRDARGLLLWMNLNYVPTTKDAAERDKSIRVSMALLRMLAVPHAYEDAVLAHGLTIVDAPEYESWPGHITEGLEEVVVAEHLSGLQVTIAMANDTWAYALNYLDALIAHPRAGWDQPTLVKLCSYITEQMEDMGIPVGMTDGIDYIPRTPGLPWPEAEINCIQEDGLFLENIPTTPPPGATERATQQQFYAGHQHPSSPMPTSAGQPSPSRSLPHVQQQQQQSPASNALLPCQWVTTSTAARLTFGAITPQSATQPPAPVTSSTPAPSIQSPTAFQPHHFIPNNMVGPPAPGSQHHYPYATVAPASINAGHTGLAGTLMTDLYHALPTLTLDMAAGFDMHPYNTGAF
ncbi:hypothetical protein C8F04DRAFT_1187727 [Mycena alexandri]|uniref:Uncharacterized protein n=1 Tax=Mycena alexandri TaxID=1745969 RepID=A0AAD6X269_9AGAR|nr:hypothetical protein C8F04DRAFT_1187727 [Mycena alexandri]